MKIYTKKGDQGETSLYGGSRVLKNHLRIEAYGTFDELNTVMGMALSSDLPSTFPGQLKLWLIQIQNEVFQIGAELATPLDQKTLSPLIQTKDIERLENEIDQMEKELPPLKHFILPSGVAKATHLQYCRTVARRAERNLVTLAQVETIRSEVLQYINRLSDYFFVASRWINHHQGEKEQIWSS